MLRLWVHKPEATSVCGSLTDDAEPPSVDVV